jgi:hypothetical protein
MATDMMIETSDISLATAVRGIARDVRGLILAGEGHPDVVAAVYRRIDGLREQLRGLPHGPLHRWVESLERELDER